MSINPNHPTKTITYIGTHISYCSNPRRDTPWGVPTFTPAVGFRRDRPWPVPTHIARVIYNNMLNIQNTRPGPNPPTGPRKLSLFGLIVPSVASFRSAPRVNYVTGGTVFQVKFGRFAFKLRGQFIELVPE